MALNDISLTAGMRSNLLALQSTSTLLDRTQGRLSTGKKVNTALDNPTNFFSAQNNTQRAADLSVRKDGMSEAIQGVKAANEGITGISALIEAAKGLTQSARSADRTGRDNLAAQFNTMLTQIDQMATDSTYKGKNFLKGDSLQVLFNENGGSFLSIQGFSATSAGLTISSVTVGTADTITSGLSGGTGTQTAATAIKTATLNTAANPLNAATGVFWAQSVTGLFSGGDTATTGSIQMNIAGNGNISATGTTYTGLENVIGSGAYTINAIYANGVNILGSGGVTLRSGISGGGGMMVVDLSGGTLSGMISGAGILAGASTVSITYDVTVQGHLRGSDAAMASNMVIFDLSGTDTASGARDVVGLDATSTTTASGGTGVSGVAVYVSGVLADAATYKFSGNQIIFTGSAVPSQTVGSVQYNYNTGFSILGANVTKKDTFTGITLTATQSISQVKVNGVAVTDYTLSGNAIKFTGTSIPAIGDQVTYTVTTAGATGAWSTDAGISTSVDQLDAALNTLRTQTAALASNLSVVNIRQDFTSNLMNDLLKGADNLTLADMNEEGANMLMLQTRQQLGTTSLKMASDAAQGVLRLF